MIKLSYAYLDGRSVDIKQFTFPCKEQHLCITRDDVSWLFGIDILYHYDGDASIMELLLAVDAIRRLDIDLETLTIPYVPFSRQDRVCNVGEPHSLRVFCELINNLKARKVVITDPHSTVCEALLNNCQVIHQHEIFAPVIRENFSPGKYWLASSDAGAAKKIYELVRVTQPKGVLECGKQRDVTTGKITGITLPLNMSDVSNEDTIIVVDDILDNGWSFYYLSKAVRQNFKGKLVLMVTHCFLNGGLDPLTLFDEVYSKEGRVK